jgi:putative DNA primase/helicase
MTDEPTTAPPPSKIRWLIDDWRDRVVFKDSETHILNPRATQNAIAMLLHRSDLAELFVRDRRSGKIRVQYQPPWTSVTSGYPRDLEGSDAVGAAAYMERHGLRLTSSAVAGAIEFVADERACDHVLEKLKSLEWDRKPRLDHWLADYLGAEDKSVTRQVGAKWLIAAAARVFRPGTKFDHILVLEGPQRIGKSTALRIIAETLGPDTFSDRLSRLDHKDSMIELRGRIVIEFAELAALRGRSADEVKAFLSRQSDDVRLPYGRATTRLQRGCVFGGTVNPDGMGYLTDVTGNSRFWGVAVTDIKADRLTLDAPQLWAEAKHRFQAGEHWWIEDPVILAELAADNMERTEADIWAERINHIILDKTTVTIREILDELGVETARQTQREQKRVGTHLRRVGWTARPVRRGAHVRSGYVRPPV